MRSIDGAGLPVPADAGPGLLTGSSGRRRARCDRLWLTDFRTYDDGRARASRRASPRSSGANGQGKTNLLEAVGYLATLSSFRGAPTDALVRAGRRAGRSCGPRASATAGALLIEAELAAGGRNRVQVNRQRLRRARDLLGALRVTRVLARRPRAGEGRARRSGAATSTTCSSRSHPRNDALRTDLDRVLRQRNALLKQAGGRLDAEVERHARRVGRQAGRGRRGAGRRPATTLVARARARCWREAYDAGGRRAAAEVDARATTPPWRADGPGRGAGRGRATDDAAPRA